MKLKTMTKLGLTKKVDARVAIYVSYAVWRELDRSVTLSDRVGSVRRLGEMVRL